MNDKPQRELAPPKENGMTELHDAAYCQNLEWVKECVQRGYDIHQKDKNGWTPLVWCIDMAATGKVGAAEAIVDHLVEQGAQTDYQNSRCVDLAAFAYSRDRAIGRHVKQLLRRQKKSTQTSCKGLNPERSSKQRLAGTPFLSVELDLAGLRR